jgi:hypothetical protein
MAPLIICLYTPIYNGYAGIGINVEMHLQKVVYASCYNSHDYVYTVDVYILFNRCVTPYSFSRCDNMGKCAASNILGVCICKRVSRDKAMDIYRPIIK